MTYEEVVKMAKRVGRPLYYDGDLVCNRCGEPWDVYGVMHGDMTKEEARRFLNGGGCPVCSREDKDAKNKI